MVLPGSKPAELDGQNDTSAPPATGSRSPTRPGRPKRLQQLELSPVKGVNGEDAGDSDDDFELEHSPFISKARDSRQGATSASAPGPADDAQGAEHRRSASLSKWKKDAAPGGRAQARMTSAWEAWVTSSWGPGMTSAWAQSFRELVLGSYLNVLLVFCPMAMVAVHLLHWPPGWIFAFSLLGLTPLAERLGFVTEQLALYTGPTVGGLLNATFGNATEIIISILALQSSPPLIRVVQLSLLGSILSNMLLVLGASFLAGGLVFREQKFNKVTATVNSGLLLMAVMGLMFPAVLQATHTERDEEQSELTLSRFSSLCMLIAYAFYLFFQLKTHSHLYDEQEVDGDEEKEEEEPVLGLWGAVVWMAVIALLISLLSDYLVDAIEGAADSWGLPVPFISVIILPIVGNAAEHASSVMFALKDKVDLSLGVAIGSSTQIAMFAIPFCVVYGWIIGVPMDLDFKLFETATLCITVLVVASLLQEGECNYFKGIMLLLCYLIVAASFYVHSDGKVPVPAGHTTGIPAAPPPA